MHTGMKVSLSHCTYLAEIDLKANGHEVTWDIVGKKLAHGHCIHCQEPIVVAKEQRLLLKTGSAFRHTCGARRSTTT